MTININQNQNQRGFTLIELLLYATIMSILLTAVVLFSAVILTARVKSQSINEVNQQGTMVMSHITQNIRNADTLTATPGTSSSTIMMMSPSTKGYQLMGDSLSLYEPGATTPLTNSRVVVSSLVFTSMGTTTNRSLIRIEFKMAYKNPSNKNEFSFERNFIGTARMGW